MAFHEVQFPTDISKGAVGGAGYLTDVVEIDNGYEATNQCWEKPRRSYDVSFGVRTQTQMETLLSFHLARHGRQHSFRFKDWMDYSISNQVCGTITALTALGYYTATSATLQLIKMYATGLAAPNNYEYREIKKPVSGSLVLQTNASGSYVTLVLNTDYTLDTTTGIVTFTGYSPAGGDSIKISSLTFDVPVRFEDDRLKMSIKEINSLYECSQCILIEVKV